MAHDCDVCVAWVFECASILLSFGLKNINKMLSFCGVAVFLGRFKFGKIKQLTKISRSLIFFIVFIEKNQKESPRSHQSIIH